MLYGATVARTVTVLSSGWKPSSTCKGPQGLWSIFSALSEVYLLGDQGWMGPSHLGPPAKIPQNQPGRPVNSGVGTPALANRL